MSLRIFDLRGNELLAFDATLEEGFSRDAEATRFPVESGPPITDHVRGNTRRYTAVALVSNDDIRVASEGDDRAGYTLAVLDELVENGDLLVVLTTQGVLENVALTAYTTRTDVRNSRSLEFALEFDEVRTATFEEVLVPAEIFALTKRSTAKPKDNTTTSPQAETQPQAEKRTDSVLLILSKLFNGQ